MTNSLMLGGVYIVMAVMLVLGRVDGAARAVRRIADYRRLPGSAIFAGGFVLFTFRDDLGWVAQRLRAEATGYAGRSKARKSAFRWRSTAISGSMRKINGHDVKFLVDSGATMTTIGTRHRGKAGVAVEPRPRPDGADRQRHHPRSQRIGATS